MRAKPVVLPRSEEKTTTRSPWRDSAATLTGLVCVLGIPLLVACATGRDAGPSSTTPLPPDIVLGVDDAELLDQLALIDVEVAGEERAVKDALRLGRDERLGALAEAARPRTSELMYQAARQLMPELLQGDHDAYVQYLRSNVGLIGRVARAIEDGDLAAAYLDTTAIVVARARTLTGVSPVYCRALAVESRAYCEGDPPEDTYEAALRRTFRQLGSDVLPRLELFPDDLTSDEAALVLPPTLGPIIKAVRDAEAAMQELEPPARWRSDHDRLVGLLGETLEAATSMQSLVESSASSVDIDVLDQLRRDAADDLSAGAKAIVAPYFDE